MHKNTSGTLSDFLLFDNPLTYVIRERYGKLIHKYFDVQNGCIRKGTKVPDNDCAHHYAAYILTTAVLYCLETGCDFNNVVVDGLLCQTVETDPVKAKIVDSNVFNFIKVFTAWALDRLEQEGLYVPVQTYNSKPSLTDNVPTELDNAEYMLPIAYEPEGDSLLSTDSAPVEAMDVDADAPPEETESNELAPNTIDTASRQTCLKAIERFVDSIMFGENCVDITCFNINDSTDSAVNIESFGKKYIMIALIYICRTKNTICEMSEITQFVSRHRNDVATMIAELQITLGHFILCTKFIKGVFDYITTMIDVTFQWRVPAPNNEWNTYVAFALLRQMNIFPFSNDSECIDDDLCFKIPTEFKWLFAEYIPLLLSVTYNCFTNTGTSVKTEESVVLVCKWLLDRTPNPYRIFLAIRLLMAHLLPPATCAKFIYNENINFLTCCANVISHIIDSVEMNQRYALTAFLYFIANPQDPRLYTSALKNVILEKDVLCSYKLMDLLPVYDNIDFIRDSLINIENCFKSLHDTRGMHEKYIEINCRVVNLFNVLSGVGSKGACTKLNTALMALFVDPSFTQHSLTKEHGIVPEMTKEMHVLYNILYADTSSASGTKVKRARYAKQLVVTNFEGYVPCYKQDIEFTPELTKTLFFIDKCC